MMQPDAVEKPILTNVLDSVENLVENDSIESGNRNMNDKSKANAYLSPDCKKL